MSGLSLCSWLRLQLLSMISPSLFLGSQSSHREPLTISHSVNSPWGCRTLAELTINRALKKITLKKFLLKSATLLKQSHFLRKALTAMTFFTLFLEQHSPNLEGFALHVTLHSNFSVCFLFQLSCGASFPCLISLRPANRH